MVDIAIHAGAELGEGPTWDTAGQRLIWVDILGARIHTYDPVSGRRTVQATEQHVGAVKPRAGGGLVACLRDGVGLYDADGSFRWLLHEPVPGRRANDAGVAPDGALWAGTMRYDSAPGGGTLTRLTGDGSAEVVLDDVTISNGLGWTADGSKLYYADTPTGRVDVFDVAEGGAKASGRRPFAEIEEGAGSPDGLCVDADGYVWVALWDGAAVRRYAPDGTLDRVIDLPVTQPTACAFGGADLTDLYITSASVGDRHPLAGSVLVLPGAGQGLAQPAFAG